MIPTSLVWSCNEWDPLEEVIVGNPLRARFPTSDPSTRLAEFPGRSLEEMPQGPFPQWIIEETEEDLNAFVAVLTEQGVTVRRPETWPHEARFSPSTGNRKASPTTAARHPARHRDQIIETPNVIRSRAQESFSYRALMLDYLRSGEMVRCPQTHTLTRVRRRSDQTPPATMSRHSMQRTSCALDGI
jgi:hypothetical protein